MTLNIAKPEHFHFEHATITKERVSNKTTTKGCNRRIKKHQERRIASHHQLGMAGKPDNQSSFTSD